MPKGGRQVGKVIDLTKLDGAHSLGEDFDSFVLGDEIKETLEKLLEAVKQGEVFSGKEGYTANNIFIDGRRGSGKTTVLLTVKEILENEKGKYDSHLKKLGLENYKFKIVDSIVDTSVNTASITFYFLGWLKKQIEENYESDFKLNEQLHKTIKLFPHYLKSCEKTCLDMSVDGDIEERLDQSDLNFRKELFKLIDLFLEKESCENKSFIVLFVDDLDISFPPERIQKILTEVFMFLSHPRLILISSGNYNNLIDILNSYFGSVVGNKLENIKIKNIAKSFLEKTFAKNSVQIPHLTYEYISTFEVKLRTPEGNFLKVPIKEFLEQLPIIKILSFESVPFRTLFNHISLRELLLILKEIFAKTKEYSFFSYKEEKFKYDKDKLYKTYVINVCFSDIYQRIRKSNVVLLFSSRKNITLKEKNKYHELPAIRYRIEKLLESENWDGISLLASLWSTENNSRILSLFLIWFFENLLFMNGWFKNIPVILFIEIILYTYRTEEDDIEGIKYLLEKFITLWKNFAYNIQEYENEYLNQNDSKLDEEIYAKIRIPSNDETFLLREFVSKKGNIDYLSYYKLLSKVTNSNLDIIEYIVDYIENIKLKFSVPDVLIRSFIEKLIEKMDKRPPLSLFLIFYYNLIYTIAQLVLKGQVQKSIYLQEFLEGVTRILKLFRYKKEPSPIEEFKKQSSSWIQEKGINTTLRGIKIKASRLEKSIESLDLFLKKTFTLYGKETYKLSIKKNT